MRSGCCTAVCIELRDTRAARRCPTHTAYAPCYNNSSTPCTYTPPYKEGFDKIAVRRFLVSVDKMSPKVISYGAFARRAFRTHRHVPPGKTKLIAKNITWHATPIGPDSASLQHEDLQRLRVFPGIMPKRRHTRWYNGVMRGGID